MDEVRGRSSAATGRQLPMAEGRAWREGKCNGQPLSPSPRNPPPSQLFSWTSQSMVALKLSTLIILLHLQQALTANLEIPLPRCIIYIMTCAHHQPTLMNFRRFEAASATWWTERRRTFSLECRCCCLLYKLLPHIAVADAAGGSISIPSESEFGITCVTRVSGVPFAAGVKVKVKAKSIKWSCWWWWSWLIMANNSQPHLW